MKNPLTRPDESASRYAFIDLTFFTFLPAFFLEGFFFA
jgi:hypothetical protein